MKLRDPRTAVLALMALAIAIGSWWGLPGSDTWCVDSVSPRSCGMGAIAESFTPGHFHTYPPLHMAILTVLSLPWMGLAATRASGGLDALAQELSKPLYMTAIEAEARLVTGLMALGIVALTMRLWSRLAGERAGLLAGIVVALNATFLYYAHTGNLEVPYLFWILACLVELERVARGEAREVRALLFAAFAALTKDQAAAALLLPLPIFLFVIPRAQGKSLVRRKLVIGAIVATVVYALVSGLATNPTGFVKRLGFLFGPASETWASYDRSLQGTVDLTRDAFLATPHFTSWAIAALALVGVGVSVAQSGPAPNRWRLLLPLLAAISFALFFNVGARRTEDRFLLPASVLCFPYAALAIDRAVAAWPRAKAFVLAGFALSLVPALVTVVSMDATLLADPRYAAERFLATLPEGAHVEVYGSTKYLPRLPSGMTAVRPGVEPAGDREQLPGVEELVDPDMDPRPRAPDTIVLATELSKTEMIDPPKKPAAFGKTTFQDDVARAFYRGLYDGSLGYTRVFVGRCELPWPLECRVVHGSTGGEVWIYGRGGRGERSSPVGGGAGVGTPPLSGTDKTP